MELTYDSLELPMRALVEARQDWVTWQANAQKSGRTYDMRRWSEEAGRFDGVLGVLAHVMEESHHDLEERCRQVVTNSDRDRTSNYVDELLNSFGYV
jgi:hypothetical protein